jgi:hypothetical protein
MITVFPTWAVVHRRISDRRLHDALKMIPVERHDTILVGDEVSDRIVVSFPRFEIHADQKSRRGASRPLVM